MHILLFGPLWGLFFSICELVWWACHQQGFYLHIILSLGAIVGPYVNSNSLGGYILMLDTFICIITWLGISLSLEKFTFFLGGLFWMMDAFWCMDLGYFYVGALFLKMWSWLDILSNIVSENLTLLLLLLHTIEFHYN